MSDTEYLFIYGTLQKNVGNSRFHLFAGYCSYFSKAYLQGKLFHVADYPGAIESNEIDDKVYGELYKVNESKPLLTQLDIYEECSANFPQPHEYVRKKILVFLPDGNTVLAWVYLYNRDIQNLERIISGDYEKARL